jgi:nitroreductase
MTLYEAIFIRRSVKKYDMTPLAHELVEDIKQYIAGIKQLDGQHAQFEIVPADMVHSASVPHYILAYCEENDAAHVNAGYVLQKIDLYIQSTGLGSWWIGMQKPKNKKKNFCILLGFGKTNIGQRKGEQDFDRLPVNEISDADNAIAKAARLAPSAVNSQPWKLHFENGKVIIKYFGRGPLKIFLKKLNKIDLGIVTRHVEVALLNEGREIKSITPKGAGKEFEIEIIYT